MESNLFQAHRSAVWRDRIFIFQANLLALVDFKDESGPFAYLFSDLFGRLLDRRARYIRGATGISSCVKRGHVRVTGVNDDVRQRHVGNHVFIYAYARRQYLGNVDVRDGGKAEIDGARSRCIFEVVHLAQGQHKGVNSVLVVHQNLTGLATLHTAEGEGTARGKTQGIDGADGVCAKGNNKGVVAHLDTFLLQLVNDAAAVDVAAQEGKDVALL